MNILLLLLSFTGLPFHDIQIAYFKIYEVEKQVYVDYIFEKEDILQTLNVEEAKLSEQKIKKLYK